jgi:hypothetical protein
MLTITAVIRAKKGREDAMRQALLDVAETVRVNEPKHGQLLRIAGSG